MDELTFRRPDELTDEEWAVFNPDPAHADEMVGGLAFELEAYADHRYRQILAARTFAPHVVGHDVEETDDVDEDGKAVKDEAGKTTKTKRDAVTACPDCTRGLVARGDALVCYDLVRYGIDVSGLTVTHHDVIACGR